LTKYLQRLEVELGEKLFDRKQYPIKLTYVGQCFYEYVKKVEEEKLKLEAKIDEFRNMGRDKIIIGMPLWRSNILFPEFFPIFSQSYPLIQVYLKEVSSSVIENQIISNEIDIGIVNLPINYANLLYEPIAQEHILLACSKKNPFIQDMLSKTRDHPFYPNIDIRALPDQPFILTQPGQYLTEYVNAMLSSLKLELNCVFRTANVSTAINLVAANVGFTFVPEIGTKSKYFPLNDIALFTLGNPPLETSLVAIYKKSKYLSNAMRLFISELRSFCNSNKWHSSERL